MTRVSERSRFEGTQNRIDAVKEFNDRVQKTAVSGRKLHRLSDDPAGAIRVFRNRTKLENVAQFKKSVDFADGFLSKSEDSLRSLNDILIRSRELAVQLSNSTYSADDRIAASEEVRQLLGQVSSIGNSTYGDKFIFGGFRTSSPPISPDGTYCGDDGQIVVQFDENTFRAVNSSGQSMRRPPSGSRSNPRWTGDSNWVAAKTKSSPPDASRRDPSRMSDGVRKGAVA